MNTRKKGLTKGIKTHYENIINSIQDAVIVVTDEGKIVLFNPAAEELMGISARRVLGEKYENIFQKNENLIRQITETLRTQESRSNSDSQIKRFDGKKVPAGIVSSILCNSRGDKEGVIILIRDLTRIKDLEEEVKRKERLAALGTLAAGVAHEIRNPMGAVKGATQLLKAEINDSRNLNEYCSVIVKEIERIDGIIESLLDIARPMRFIFKPVNIHQVIDKVLFLMQKNFKEKDILCIRIFDPSLPLITADEGRLAQVFMNIISNSCDAMIKSGRLIITTKIASDSFFSRIDTGSGFNSMIEISIADEGRGIPKEIKDRVFDLFFTTKDKGTGLGLSICHRIIEEHKGLIRVQSEEEQGTTFTIYLPIQR